MKLHSQAALTLKQRQKVKRLHDEGVSIRDLAQRFGVNPTTPLPSKCGQKERAPWTRVRLRSRLKQLSLLSIVLR